jgi:hypothetical protein
MIVTTNVNKEKYGKYRAVPGARSPVSRIEDLTVSLDPDSNGVLTIDPRFGLDPNDAVL